MWVTLLLGCCRIAFAIDDTNVIAMGAWSEPVASESGQRIRGRLLMCAYPDRDWPTNRVDVGVYVELQEWSDPAGPIHVYCDFVEGLKCDVLDAAGKPPEPVGTGFSGGAPGPFWVSLPPYGSMRLRASTYSGGRLKDGSLGLWFAGEGLWTIKATDTNTYFLSATLSVTPPQTNFDQREVWRGTLTLPKMQVPRTAIISRPAANR